MIYSTMSDDEVVASDVPRGTCYYSSYYSSSTSPASATWDMNWSRAGFWALDQPPFEDVNLYGVHPVMMVLGKPTMPGAASTASGIFLLNSNAMEAILQPYPAGKLI